ncbi:MarR family transcriptional regulator [Paenibacillus sp. KQZ6P-2]|uniref:MarR family transcriptional regulator n=1 Tax=Paenibacillus mangrovi TaxID=2931978 RepID=A0A9X1WWC6_9BACL|nr:MarR family transcriptional regulator [Paenibacillus mangrovi]MCJ8014758.1 MarR family transcriptional regulator [Paenibacillus mangrovi]
MKDSGDNSIIDKLQNFYIQLISKFGHCTGISPSRFRLMQQLFHVDEINQTTLQKELQIDRAAITRHLKQLEGDGIVTRRINPDDNRFTLVRLTDHGRQEIVAYREEKILFMAQLLQGFSEEEQKLFANMIERMQENINHIKGEN